MRQHALVLRRDRRKEEQHGVMALFDIPMNMMSRVGIEPEKLYMPEPPREPFKLQ
jgi:hypothetical protein